MLQLRFSPTLTLAFFIASLIAESPVRAYDIRDPLDIDPVYDPTSAVGPIVSGLIIATSLFLTRAEGIPSPKRAIETRMSLIAGYGHDDADITRGHMGFAWHVRNWLSLGVDGFLAAARGDTERTVGAGGGLFFRWELLHSHRSTFFFEQNGGFVLFESPFPAGGTRLNGQTSYGVGAEISLTPKSHLLFLVGHQHVSNGQRGLQANPAFDGIGIYTGYRFFNE